MKILLLGPENKRIEKFMTDMDYVISRKETILDANDLNEGYDFVISFGYRHIIAEEYISFFYRRLINLHISYLPWNRGADPNLWSFLEDTPKGVSIHYIDVGLDTGEVLIQGKVDYLPEDTLRSSYARLKFAIETALIENWDKIYNGELIVNVQGERGTFHKAKDKEKYLSLVHSGWDTPVKDILGAALHEKE